MNRPRLALVLAFVAAWPASGLAEQRIALRLAPSPDAHVLARVAPDHPALESAARSLGAQGEAAGWKWTEHEAAWTGFVATRQTGKNVRPERGALVRARPEKDAPVITRIGARENVRAAGPSGDWVEVRLQKALPVYFRPIAPSAPRTASAADRDPRDPGSARASAEDNGGRPAPKPSGAPGARRPRSEERSDAEPIGAAPPILAAAPPRAARTAEAAAEPQRLRASADANPETGQGANPSAEPPPGKRRPSPAPATRTLSGTLRGRPDAPPRTGGVAYRLLAENGERLAYLDVSHSFIHDLRPLLGRDVVARGELGPMEGQPAKRVLRVRTLRPAE